MTEEQLLHAAQTSYTLLKEACPALPDASYTVHYDHNMTGSTIAYATAWFYDTLPVLQDPSYPGHDFEIALHPGVTWHHGPCSDLPHGAYDLQTTMLHEIIHGVGIISSIRADKSAMPLIYDLQLRDTNGQPVVTTSFTGAFGQSLHVNGVDVYNPPTYTPGSSFSHYTHHGIMDPSQHVSECIRHVDNDVKRMLQAIGYDCPISASTPSPNSDTALPIILGIAGAVILIAVIAAFACRKETPKGREYRPLP